MSDYTRGPWRRGKGYMSNLVEGRAGAPRFDGDDGYGTVAVVQFCCAGRSHAALDRNLEANVNLILAAPELLEALEWMVLNDGEGEHDAHHEAGVMRALKAIAKAKGECIDG